MKLLRPRGRYIMLGVPPKQPTLAHTNVIFKCLVVSGSLVGNVKMTQEMLDFCGEKNITADVEVGGRWGLWCSYQSVLYPCRHEGGWVKLLDTNHCRLCGVSNAELRGRLWVCMVVGISLQTWRWVGG